MSCFKGSRLGALAIAAGLLLALAGFANAETISWRVDEDGDWQDASNWDLGRVPQAGDDVVIDRPAGDYTVTYSSGTTAIRSLSSKEALVVSAGELSFTVDSSIEASLTLSGGWLSHEARLTVSGLLTWTVGSFGGSGTTVAGGGIEISGTGTKEIRDGHTIDNATSALWVGPGRITGRDGAVLNNLAGATFVVRNASENEHLLRRENGATFNNLGTVRKEGSGWTSIHVAFDNHDSVEVSEGTLEFAHGGAGSGGFTTAAGTVLVLGSKIWSHEFTGGPVDADGDVRILGGAAVRLSGAYRVAGETYVSGTVIIDGGSTGSLTLAGYIRHDGELTVSGLMTWTGGELRGTGRTVANGGLELSGGTKQILDGHVLENPTAAVWTGPGSIGIGNGSKLRNLPGATFTARNADSQKLQLTGDRVSAFENSGTFRKEGVGPVSTYTKFNNHGTVDLLEGELTFLADGSGAGSFAAAAGTVLAFARGDHLREFIGGSIDSDGDVHFRGYRTTLSGAYRVAGETLVTGGLSTISGGTTGSLTFGGGNLYCDGELSVSGPLVSTDGLLGGSGRTVAHGGIEISGTKPTYLEGHTLENPTTAVWRSSAHILCKDGAVFRNLPGATFVCGSDSGEEQAFALYGSDATLENQGTIRKEGSGLTRINMVLDHDGAVEIQGGTLRFDKGGSGDGTFTTAEGTVLLFSPSTGRSYDFSTGPGIDADGDVLFTAGTIVIGGTYRAAGETRVEGHVTFVTVPGGSTGSLWLDGNTLTCEGDLTVSDLFTWQRGTSNGAGRTSALGAIEFRTGDTKVLDGRALDSAVRAEWCEPSGLALRNGASFNNLAGALVLFKNDTEQEEAIGGGGSFNNLGTVRKEGSGLSRISSPFDHRGAVMIAEGILQLDGTGAGPGTFEAVAGTVLLIKPRSGAWTHDYSSGIDSSGEVHFETGISTIGGTYRADEGTVVAGQATIQNGSTGSLTLSNVLRCEGDLEVSGLFAFRSGKLLGAGRLLANGGIELSTGGQKVFAGPIVENAGDCVWSEGRMDGVVGAFNNHAGATFEVRSDDPFVWMGPFEFDNHGALLKSAGTGTSWLNLVFNNHGTVEVQTGTLRLQGGGTCTGSFDSAAGTALEFAWARPYEFSETSRVTALGDLLLFMTNATVAGAFSVAGNTTVHGGSVTVPGCTLGTLTIEGYGQVTFDDDLTVSGLLALRGATLHGSGRLLANGGIELSTGENVFAGPTVENAGACAWTSGRVHGQDGTFNNLAGATFEVRTDSPWINGALHFSNRGVFVKASGTGTTLFNVVFTNQGSIEVQGGTLSLPGAFSTTGDITIAGGATLSRTGDYTQTAGTTTLAGGTLTATGIVDIQGGVLAGDGTVDASLVNAGIVRPGGSDTAGILGVTGSYSGTGAIDIEIGDGAFDRFEIGGAATLGDGTLNLALLGGFVPATSSQFLVMQYASHLGEFAVVTGTQITAVKEFLLDYDAAGGLTLTVEGDETPPVISSITADPDVIWPPDHKLKKEVTVTLDVSDDSGDPVTLSVEVSSSEGTNEHEPDWETVSIDSATGVVVVKLRAERDGNAPGRIYTITVTATDSSGNQATTAVNVLVPHDER